MGRGIPRNKKRIPLPLTEIFLSSANKVWGKVMFYTTPVCHSVHREGVGFPVCIIGHMTREGLHLGGYASRGACIQWKGVGMTPLRYMRYYGIWPTSRQYTSYWNEFFLGPILTGPDYRLSFWYKSRLTPLLFIRNFLQGAV